MCTIDEIKQSLPILKDLPIGVLITDIDGNIEYVNDALTKINGYSKDELLGENPRMLKSGFHNDEFYQRLWNTLLEGKVFKGEINNKRKDGTDYWQNIVIQPYNKLGNITHFVAYINDVTEQRFESLLAKTLVTNSYDSHLLWNKDRICFRSYPSLNNHDNPFYKNIIGNKLDKDICNICGLTEEQIEEHNRLFDEIDENGGIVGTTLTVYPEGKKKVVQILMQRFNSNKFYETLRDVTEFYETDTSILDKLAEVIEERKQLNYNIREELNGEQARAFVSENLK